MSKKRRRRGFWMGFLVLILAAGAHAEEAQAFVTGVKGKARIGRADGKDVATKVGNQLFVGDKLHVSEGEVILIYLSGRSEKVGAGKTHSVKKGKDKASPLMRRIKDTLGEIAGPQKDAERPVVHGMVRGFAGLTGALPANSRVSSGNFAFEWDSLEGIEEYEFTLESAKGGVLITRTVTGRRLAAEELALKPGRRYVWKVEETNTFLPRSSGKSWVLVATSEDGGALRRELDEVVGTYDEETTVMLQTAILYRGEYFFEAERVLQEVQKKRPLTEAEKRILLATYVEMKRWERLPADDTPNAGSRTETR